MYLHTYVQTRLSAILQQMKIQKYCNSYKNIAKNKMKVCKKYDIWYITEAEWDGLQTIKYTC